MAFKENLPGGFLTARPGLWIWGRKTMEVKCPFLTSFKGHLLATGLNPCWCWPWSPVWGCACQVFSSRVTPRPPHTVLFGGKSLNKWQSALPPWMWNICINYLEFFGIGDLSFSPIYLCNHSYQYGLMDIYFILPTLLLFCCSNVLAVVVGGSFCWRLHPSEPPPAVCWSPQHSLFPAVQDVPGSSSCLSPRISHFSKEPWFLFLENGIRNQDLDADTGCLFKIFFNFASVSLVLILP